MNLSSLALAQKNILQALSRPLILFLLIMVVAFVSVQVLAVNSYDNAFQSRASWNVFVNHRWPADDPAEQQRTLYFNPPHSAIITAPFVMFGPHVAAFFATVFILILFVGERRGLAALLTLLFVLTPPMMFVIAEAGLIGFTTGLGLIFVLADKRGPMRAFSWAMLAVRPQDNLPVLIWSGIEALRQKDWKAFVLGGLTHAAHAAHLGPVAKAIAKRLGSVIDRRGYLLYAQYPAQLGEFQWRFSSSALYCFTG